MSMKIAVALASCLGFAAPAYAASPSSVASYRVAQATVPDGATGGPSGGPNQAQAVVPAGSTGGRSGGPNQAQSVKKMHKMKKKSHH